MNLRECFDTYELFSIHIKSNPSGNGVSWVPVSERQVINDIDAYDNIYEGILELFDDASFTEGDYDFMAGVLTLEGDTLVFNGSQTREVTFTKTFRTPVLT